VEDILVSVNQQIQDLRKELKEKIDKTQVDVQVIKTSLEMRIRSHLEKIPHMKTSTPRWKPYGASSKRSQKKSRPEQHMNHLCHAFP
jgi:hypothetical protein